MVKIYPFKAFRPKPEYASKIASYPYDVIDSNEARILAKGDSLTFLHVVKSEIDFDPSLNIYDEKIYQKAKDNLFKLISEGYLVQDNKPCLYVYTQKMGNHLQKGLVICGDIWDYKNNIIKKHELTREDKERDRTRHIEVTNANTGPVFLTYRAQKQIDEIIDKEMKKKPVYDFTAVDGIIHTVYLIDDDKTIKYLAEKFSDIDYLYIADGHHRSASTAKVGYKKAEANPKHTGNEEYNRFLAVAFPHNQLKILDYNRVVKDLNGLSKEGFLKKVGEKFAIEPVGSEYKPEKLHIFGMYLDKQWYKLTAKEGTFEPKDPVKSLDVSILQDNLLCPLLNIKDPRTDKRINFVGGIRGLKELVKLVDSGDYKVAFAMCPVSLEELMAIADAGEIMPPKSTWFEPKLRSGLFIHFLD